MPVEDEQVVTVGRALGHPMRVRLIRRLRGSESESAARLAEEMGESLGLVSYHMRELAKLGITHEVSARPVRGALEHFFAFGGPDAEAVSRALDALDDPPQTDQW